MSKVFSLNTKTLSVTFGDLHASMQQTNEQMPTSSKLVNKFTCNYFPSHLLTEQRYSSTIISMEVYDTFREIIECFEEKLVVTVCLLN